MKIKINKLPTFPSSSECINCGDRCCCKVLPGGAFPEDFNLPASENKLREILASGLWSIDWWEGDPRDGMSEIDRGYYVRPATINKQGVLFDGSWGGVCVFLKKNGCALPIEDRPGGCRSLKPRTIPTEKCHYPFWGELPTMIKGNGDKQMAALAWIPYHQILLKIAEEITEEGKTIVEPKKRKTEQED
jgi:hypothetical protein